MSSNSESSGRVPRREAMTVKGKPRCKAIVCGEKIEMGDGKVARYQLEQCDKQCAAGAEVCTVCERAMPKYLKGDAGRVHGMANLREIADWSHGYTRKSLWHRNQTAKEMGKIAKAVAKATAAAAEASVAAAEVQTAAVISESFPVAGGGGAEVDEVLAAKKAALDAAKAAAKEARDQYELAKKLRADREAVYKTLLKETAVIEKSKRKTMKGSSEEKRKTQKAVAKAMKDMERATATELAEAKKAAAAAERDAKRAETQAAKAVKLGKKPEMTVTQMKALDMAFKESGAIDRGYSSSPRRTASAKKSSTKKPRRVSVKKMRRRSIGATTPTWSQSVNSAPNYGRSNNTSQSWTVAPRTRRTLNVGTPAWSSAPSSASSFNANAALANLMTELGEAGSVAF